jgi:hypothetical protein
MGAEKSKTLSNIDHFMKNSEIVEVEIENELLEFFYMNLDCLSSVHYGFQEKPTSYTLTQKIRKPNISKPLGECKPKSSTR